MGRCEEESQHFVHLTQFEETGTMESGDIWRIVWSVGQLNFLKMSKERRDELYGAD